MVPPNFFLKKIGQPPNQQPDCDPETAFLRVWRNGRRTGLKILRGQPREGSSPSTRTSGENGIFACFRFFLKRKAARLHLFSPPLATKRNSQFVASKNASIFGEKEQTSDSVSMFASANKRQERSLRRRRDLIRFNFK